MKDSKKILIKSICDSSKKSDKYLFALIVVCVYSLISFRESTSSFEIALIGLKIDDTIYYYLFLGVTITSLFAVVGSNIINYIVKRFAFALEVRKCIPEKRDLLFELIPNTIYEFLYEELLGRHFGDRTRLNDKSRKFTFIILRVTLLLINLTALYCPYKLFKNSYPDDIKILILSVVFFVVIISFSWFLWKSFRETLERRIKRIIRWKNSIEKQEKITSHDESKQTTLNNP